MAKRKGFYPYYWGLMVWTKQKPGKALYRFGAKRFKEMEEELEEWRTKDTK